jgi:hypothetical protein
LILSNKIYLKLFFVNIYADAKLLESLGVRETGTLGEKLGSGAHLDSLQRSRSGQFRVENALTVEQVMAILQNCNQ